jgi:hypothetical protein
VRLIGNIQWFRVWRNLRFALGLIVLGSVLWINLPISTATIGSLCTLACCSGRAPHAAGSCMNGSCHAVLNRARSHAHKPIIHVQEQLCGLPQLGSNTRLARAPKAKTATRSYTQPADSNHLPDGTAIGSSSIGKPCQPDCGSCTSAFANSNRLRNKAALSYGSKPRPPSGRKFNGSDANLTRQLAVLCRERAPRGPPVSLS